MIQETGKQDDLRKKCVCIIKIIRKVKKKTGLEHLDVRNHYFVVNENFNYTSIYIYILYID